MNTISDIANVASYVSAQKMSKTKQEVEISVLKKSMDLQEEQAAQLIELLKEATPHLGQNVNIEV